MDKKEKEALDAYRQERKDRIAKQTKRANKKTNSHVKGKAILAKIAKVVVAAAVIVAIIGGTLNFFGVPQRLINSVEIDGNSYSMSELSCYYMQVYNYYAYYSYYYDSNYGEGYGSVFTGYDYNLSPADQTKTDEDGNKVTWDEFFLEEAINEMAKIKRYYKLAIDAGIELTDEAKAEIQESIDGIQDQIDSYKNTANAQTANYSISRFLTLQYGKGVTESFYEKVLTEQKYVELYQESRQEALEDNYTFDQIEAEYKKDTAKYDVVSFRWYTIKIVDDDSDKKATDAQVNAATQAAQTFIDAVKSKADYNEETFKQVVLDTVGEKDKNYESYKEEAATLLQKATKEKISSNVSDDAAKWLYEKNDAGEYTRQAGEMKYFVDSDKKNVYILYATGVPARDETKPVDVRHILVKFPEDKATAKEEASGETATGEDESAVNADNTADKGVSQATKDKCFKEAKDILADYETYIKTNLDGKPDEDYFIELAKEHTDDTGSKDSGGLIEDMINNGTYVGAFEDWAFTEGDYEGESREAGSTGIIETEYGYHVMYYVGEDENAEWYHTILHELVDADWEKEQTEFEESFAEDTIQKNEKVVAWVKDACLEIIGK